MQGKVCNMIITLKEVKEYARIDIDEDNSLLETLIVAAEEYLKTQPVRNILKPTKMAAR